MFANILRINIIVLSLTIHPYNLNKILYAYYNNADLSIPIIDRMWVLMNLLANVLWFLYATIVNEWILVFTATFNSMVLVVTLIYDTRQRYKQANISHIKPSEACPFLLADSMQQTRHVTH